MPATFLVSLGAALPRSAAAAAVHGRWQAARELEGLAAVPRGASSEPVEADRMVVGVPLGRGALGQVEGTAAAGRKAALVERRRTTRRLQHCLEVASAAGQAGQKDLQTLAEAAANPADPVKHMHISHLRSLLVHPFRQFMILH